MTILNGLRFALAAKQQEFYFINNAGRPLRAIGITTKS